MLSVCSPLFLILQSHGQISQMTDSQVHITGNTPELKTMFHFWVFLSLITDCPFQYFRVSKTSPANAEMVSPLLTTPWKRKWEFCNAKLPGDSMNELVGPVHGVQKGVETTEATGVYIA